MKFAFRQLAKTPGFTVVALLTIALGIGVTTTAFTVLNRLLLQSLPFREPQRLVQIWRTSSQADTLPQTPGDFFDMRDQATVFEKMALYYVNFMGSFAQEGQPIEQSVSMVVTGDYLPMMGITPMLGRAFTLEDEEKQEPVIILSDRFWEKKFGRDPHALGRTVRANGKSFTIIGIMSPKLNDPMLFQGPIDFWTLDNAAVNRNLRGNGWYMSAARLKSGVTLNQAQMELKTLAARYAHDFPKTNADTGFRVIPYPSDSIGVVGARLTWLIMALSAAVLLIACVNLANLQLVRTTGRTREIAIRLAMGASRRQLIRLLLSESLLLALVGGALGLTVAKWSNSYLANYLSLEMPLDLRVLGFAFAVSALTGVLFGTVPAWLASRTDVNRGLKQSARGSTADRSRHRLRQTLIVVELALALTLLAGAGYFVRGLQRLTHQEMGWHADQVLIGIFSLPHDRFGEEGDERSSAFADRFREDLLAIPGVDETVMSRGAPIFGLGRAVPISIDGRPPQPPGKEPIALMDSVGPGFFKLYDIHLLQGRDFTRTDQKGSPQVVIVNQALADKFWPGESPLGKRIGNVATTKQEWWEVVGVVNNMAQFGDIGPLGSNLQAYRPFPQNSHRFITFSVHSKNDVRTASEGVRKALARIEPDVAITFLATGKEILNQQLGGFTLVRRLLIEIAVLGLLLAAVGIYGVIANLASERTQEIGIRMALGAQPNDVRWLFLSNGFRLAAIGTALGLLCAFGLTHVLSTMLAIVPGKDPWMVLSVAGLLIVVSLLACWLPARKATKVNPLVALQGD